MTLFCRTTVLTGESGKNPRCMFTRRRRTNEQGREWWLEEENQLHHTSSRSENGCCGVCTAIGIGVSASSSKFQAKQAGRLQLLCSSEEEPVQERAQAAPVGAPAAGWPKLRVLGSRHTTSHRAGPLFIQLQTRQQSLPQILNPRTNLFPKIVKTIIIQHM